MTSLFARTTVRLCLAIGAVAAASVIAQGIERKPLPAFTLTTLDGSPVSSADLIRSGDWLLVSVRPACAPCDTLLRTTINAAAAPGVPAHTVVVIGGVDPATAARLAESFTDLTGIAWYADPAGAMKDALPVAAAPVVFGMRGSMVEWSLAGVVPDAVSMRTALVSWVSRAQ
jgi:hypothetical protein